MVHSELGSGRRLGTAVERAGWVGGVAGEVGRGELGIVIFSDEFICSYLFWFADLCRGFFVCLLAELNIQCIEVLQSVDNSNNM